MANTIYENFVLESKIEDILTSNVDFTNYMTIDNSLTLSAGMKKIVNKYTASGQVEDLAMGIGNTKEISVGFTPVEYEVGTTQGRFSYYDEQAMTDPMVVDTGVKGLTATMVNDFISKAIKEYDKATLTQTFTKASGIKFEDVVDALSKLNMETEMNLFMIVSPSMLGSIRKNLKDLLSYSEGYARTGYVGSVSGVPIIVSKALTAEQAFLASPEAVTLFIKKGAEVEQERDANLRQTTVYGRKVTLVALTDATKIVKFTSTTGA